MALVCFPFKKEHVPTLLRNVDVAAKHPNVSLVLLAGAQDNNCFREVSKAISARQSSSTPYTVPVRAIVQDRLGTTLRPGKGDGMNSALKYFLNAHKQPENRESLQGVPLQRVHFYDADIESFNGEWISKAEEGASLGYDVIRHYFPRSSTDAQVTWLVTKVGFAMLWPRTMLPWVQQPLGGELCFTRHVVETLVSDPRVMRQSNWGIDTLYTFVCAQKGFSLLEAYMPQGKMHALYGGLRDLRTMLCECFAAIQSLQHENVRCTPTVHRIDPQTAVPETVTTTIGYDVEKSLKLLRENWNDRQLELLSLFDGDVQDGLLAAMEWPEFSFMDEEAWIKSYKILLKHFDLDDDDWREVLFKMWVARVLNYTMRHVLRGYHVAQQAHTAMVMKLHMQRSREMVEMQQGKSFSESNLLDLASDVQSDSSPTIEEVGPKLVCPISPLPVTAMGESHREAVEQR